MLLALSFWLVVLVTLCSAIIIQTKCDSMMVVLEHPWALVCSSSAFDGLQLASRRDEPWDWVIKICSRTEPFHSQRCSGHIHKKHTLPLRYHDFGMRKLPHQSNWVLLSESDWLTLLFSYGKKTLDKLMEPGQDICNNARHCSTLTPKTVS